MGEGFSFWTHSLHHLHLVPLSIWANGITLHICHHSKPRLLLLILEEVDLSSTSDLSEGELPKAL